MSKRQSVPTASARADRRETSQIAGEMAAQRLHDLIEDRFEELQITQAEIAERIDAREQQVSRWVARVSNMTVKSAGRLLAGTRRASSL